MTHEEIQASMRTGLVPKLRKAPLPKSFVRTEIPPIESDEFLFFVKTFRAHKQGRLVISPQPRTWTELADLLMDQETLRIYLLRLCALDHVLGTDEELSRLAGNPYCDVFLKAAAFHPCSVLETTGECQAVEFVDGALGFRRSLELFQFWTDLLSEKES
jgi:hypothetical protein